MMPPLQPAGGRRRDVPCALAFVGLALLGGCTRSTPPTPVQIAPSTVISASSASSAPQVTRQTLRFTDVTKQADIHWQFNNGATGRYLTIEHLGGGVALLDYDGDGLLDIFALQGGPVPGAATPAERRFPTRSALYRNNGDGTFTDVTDRAGLARDFGYGQGVAVADYDNDGRPDLYLTCYGGSHLLRNKGDGTFEDVTDRAGVADLRGAAPGEPPWPLSAAWGDYDGDGRLDLFVCHYARWSPQINKDCRETDGQLTYCRPMEYESSVCALFHNNGDGTFTDVTRRAGLDKVRGKSMGAVWLDADADGRPDLFVTNDTMPNALLRNDGDGTFTDRAITAGVAFSDQGRAQSGMGIAAADYDADGRQDLFVVNFSGEPKSVFHNLGRGLFENAGYQTGLASSNQQYLGFGLESLDYDLDGNPDLLVGNGHVFTRMNQATAGSSYAESQQLFHNVGGGKFAEDPRSLGDLVAPRVTRGLAVGDLDNDGDPDAVMVSQTGPLQVFRNDGGSDSGWLTLRLEGTGRSSRDALGARVTLRTPAGPRTQWVVGSTSYCSHSDTRLTFGLGASTAGVSGGEVRWPDGRAQRLPPLAPRRFYWLREGQQPAPDPRVKTDATTTRPASP